MLALGLLCIPSHFLFSIFKALCHSVCVPRKFSVFLLVFQHKRHHILLHLIFTEYLCSLATVFHFGRMCAPLCLCSTMDCFMFHFFPLRMLYVPLHIPPKKAGSSSVFVFHQRGLYVLQWSYCTKELFIRLYVLLCLYSMKECCMFCCVRIPPICYVYIPPRKAVCFAMFVFHQRKLCSTVFIQHVFTGCVMCVDRKVLIQIEGPPQYNIMHSLTVPLAIISAAIVLFACTYAVSAHVLTSS